MKKFLIALVFIFGMVGGVNASVIDEVQADLLMNFTQSNYIHHDEPKSCNGVGNPNCVGKGNCQGVGNPHCNDYVDDPRVNTVPEPSTALLVLLGAALFLIVINKGSMKYTLLAIICACIMMSEQTSAIADSQLTKIMEVVK